MLFLQIATLFLVALTMALSVAHALEYPGKMRLNRENYIATQTIYYPGFTIGGIAEPLAAAMTLLLLVLTPRDNRAFDWTLVTFLAIIAVQVVFWLVTQPVNRFWMRGTARGPAQRFFSLRSDGPEDTILFRENHWQRLRDRWERSHIMRASLAIIGFVSLTAGIALYGRG